LTEPPSEDAGVNFADFIEREAGVLRKLHEDIHFHFDRKALGNQHARLWREACARFHSYQSALYPWIETVEKGDHLLDGDTREFVLTFLEIDPRFFRSGYIKETLLKRLKSATLMKKERDRVNAVLLDAVRRRGGREFRRYCQLAAKFGSEALRDDVAELKGAADNAVAGRATMMLRYLQETTRSET
jgi:hypothetical protein